MTQDQKSSVVFGMPGVVAMAKLSDLSLPSAFISGRIIHVVCESIQMVKSV